jgi:hyperosmotically inducible protein
MTAVPARFGTMRLIIVLASGVLLAGCADLHSPPHFGGYVDDAAINAKIKSEMAADKNADLAAVTVETTSGAVLLSGFAHSPLDKQTAESIAIKIKGVSQVKNEIALRP